MIFDCFSPLRHYSNHLCTAIIIITSYLTLQLLLAGRSACVALMVFLELQTQQVVTNQRQKDDLISCDLFVLEDRKGKPERKTKYDGFLPRLTPMTAGNCSFLLPSTTKYTVTAAQSLLESSSSCSEQGKPKASQGPKRIWLFNMRPNRNTAAFIPQWSFKATHFLPLCGTC